MTIELEIEIGDIDGNAVPLQFLTTRERILVQTEQAIGTDFGCDEERILYRFEEVCI